MALPKDIRFVTFDCYGTLIDWEGGAFAAFEKEAGRDDVKLNRDQVITRFLEIQKEIQSGSYELYAEVLRRTAVQVAKDIDWALEPSRSGFLPDSVPDWPPFRDANPALDRMAKKGYSLGILSNVDDKLLGSTRRHFRVDFDLVVTAQQTRSYKPEPAHFKEAERRIGSKRGWVHVAESHYHDVDPCVRLKIPVIWVNRKKEKLEPGMRQPTAEVRDLRAAAKLLKA